MVSEKDFFGKSGKEDNGMTSDLTADKERLTNERRKSVYTDQIEHTARRFSAWLPPIQCTLSGHQCMMIIQV